MASMLFGFCYWLVDVKQVRRPVRPLVVFGVNSIAVYVLSMAVGEVLERITLRGENLRVRICETLFTWWAPPEAASLLFAVSYVLVWLGVMEVLYRRKIFIKI
jgi:predicted acyltransferase